MEQNTGKNPVTAWVEKQAGRPLKLSDKIIGGVLIFVFLCVFYIMLDANKYRAQVNVVDGSDKVGVNPTSESLDFGDLSRGTSAVRRVSIENGTPSPMYIMVFKTGGISELMDIDKNFFTLSSRSATKLEFTTYVPASGEVGHIYKGRVYLFKIPTFGI